MTDHENSSSTQRLLAASRSRGRGRRHSGSGRDDWSQDNGNWNQAKNCDWEQDCDDWNMSRFLPVPSAISRSSIGAGNRMVVTMGWHRDPPEFRDYCIHWRKPGAKKGELTLGRNEVVDWLRKSKSSVLESDKLPEFHYENIDYCSPIEDQGSLGSCTAQSVVGLMEYNMRRSGIEHIDGSRLFVYKVTRKLMGIEEGDYGAYIRKAMQAVAAFGIPPEENWPYEIDSFDDEPNPFVYTYATNFKAMRYARLDGPGMTGEEVLEDLKRTLNAGFCVVFGFSVFSSLDSGPDIPFPSENDSFQGGHAVMAVGYDDTRENIGMASDGAIIIRNSWGPHWGLGGYGYLPYDYILEGLSNDFWTALSWDWLKSGEYF